APAAAATSAAATAATPTAAAAAGAPTTPTATATSTGTAATATTAAAGAAARSSAGGGITVAAMSLPASVSAQADGAAVSCLPAGVGAAARHVGRRLQAVAAPKRGHRRREGANRWRRSCRGLARRFFDRRGGGGGHRRRCRGLGRRLSCKLDGLCHIGDSVLVITFVGIDSSPIVVSGNVLRVEFNGFAKVGDRLIVFILRCVGDPPVAVGYCHILFRLMATLDKSRTRFQFAIGPLAGAVLPIVRGRRYRPHGERQTCCEEHHFAHRSSPGG